MQTIRPHNPAKAYLQRYRALLWHMRSLEGGIRELRERLTGTTQAITGDPVTGGGGHDRMAEVVAKIADAEAQLGEQAARISAELAAVRAAIDAVPDATQRAVLAMRYVEGLDWLTIQERTHYEKTQVFVIHGRALVAVNEWLEEQEKERMI